MENTKKREKTIYDDSLSGIFFRSGLMMLVMLLIACVAIGAVVLFTGGSDSREGIKLIFFCLLMVVPCSYVLPLVSLIKVWKQERSLGVYWKNRTDQELPEWERDWYLTCDRAGFILVHRAYIRHMKSSKVEIEDTGSYNRGKAYCAVFEDMNGKLRSLKFSSESVEKEFQQWYKKQPYGRENE
ncbi:MAG: hypothetical protein KIC52_03250 [Firmicutes bacterium]|nr:hypothetical protein [Bacillota bacterium]